MKNLILIICLFIATNSSAQSFTNFDLKNHGCSFVFPPPPAGLTYYFMNDTLHLELVKYGHCCQKPFVTMTGSNNSYAINIQDTSSMFCACDCDYQYSLELYGFPGNEYFINFNGVNYSIIRTTGLEPVSGRNDFIERRGNILFIQKWRSDFSLQIFDMKGRLLVVFQDDKIDLNSLGLRSGVYVFRLNGSDVNYSEKIFLE